MELDNFTKMWFFFIKTVFQIMKQEEYCKELRNKIYPPLQALNQKSPMGGTLFPSSLFK